MSDPTYPPRRDPDDPLVAAADDVIVGPRGDEPLDEDLDDDMLDSAEADEQAAREGTKGMPDGEV
ncbi:hypothetical protein ABZ477_11685 [Microbacterium sp. NPDC019599]|uniref:hypothetical protein n=1 Tax=Microbacterium sp. NPDC019599 TaxID=3154690 RepID=UPI0033E36D41